MRTSFLTTTLLLCVFIRPPDAAGETACSPDIYTSASAATDNPLRVQDLLKAMPIDTKWADVPIGTKTQLQTLAADRLAAYHERWAANALAKKERALLECPTPAMTAGIDDFYRKSYDTIVAPAFSLKDLANVTLRRALVRNYLGGIAASRAGLTYPNAKLPNRDWDGKSLFDSVRLPDKETYEDIKRYNASIVADLKGIQDSSLTDLEKRLRQRVLFDTRSNAAGSRGDSYGADYLETACDISELNYDILAGYEGDGGRPKIFATDEDVLREANALYLHNTTMKWLDVGTLNSALNYCATAPDRIKTDVTNAEIAKDLLLLKNWWVERISAAAAAHNRCSVYSEKDRAQIWDAFSADQQFNNDGSSSLEAYQILLGKYKQDKIIQYREAAKLALQKVFPDDSVLTSGQRATVIVAIEAATAFGLLPVTIASALDAAQGVANGPASQQWRGAIATKVKYIGGGYATDDDPPRAGDRAEIEGMFGEVKTWIATRYQGYPIDFSALYANIPFEVNTKSNAFTENNSAKILIGVGTARSKMEYYSWLIHELRHAIFYAWKAHAPDKSKVKVDEGPALEGSGVAVEAILLEPFSKDILKDETAYALFALDYGIRDARFAGTTDATLQKYFRDGCSSTTDRAMADFG